MSEIFKAVNESLSMEDVARHFGYIPNRAGFIKSPFKEERTPLASSIPGHFMIFHRVLVAILFALLLPFWD